MQRIISWFYSIAYKLENHYLFKTSLANWLWFLLVLPPLIAWVGRLAWWTAILLSLLVGLLLVGIQWAKRNDYVVFEPEELEAGNMVPPPIETDEPINAWASGLFSVGNKEKTVLDSAAQFSYVSTREHIIMARVEQTRFLLLSQSMKAEAGLWYVFFMPGVIEKVVTGTIWHGFKSRPGLAIHYWPEERPDKEDVFYLGFPDVESLQRVRADIQIDAPAKAFETA